MVQLIADSGATKCEWTLLTPSQTVTFATQGISPYFLNEHQISALVKQELVPLLNNATVDEIHYYGTGLSNTANIAIVKKALEAVFAHTKVDVQNDLLAAARALCGENEGIACILGTGSNSCYFNGKEIIKNSPGLGYVLGDEGSGAYLGKKVIQYFLYETFDDELRDRFIQRFHTNQNEILDKVYKQPLANRYLASFAVFLAENRGHYMVENIIEDGLNEFFYTHLYKYKQTWSLPLHFTGSVAFGFKDVLSDLCNSYELELGNVLKKPMDGLIHYHSK